jgi:hypothetical protein
MMKRRMNVVSVVALPKLGELMMEVVLVLCWPWQYHAVVDAVCILCDLQSIIHRC